MLLLPRHERRATLAVAAQSTRRFLRLARMRRANKMFVSSMCPSLRVTEGELDGCIYLCSLGSPALAGWLGGRSLAQRQPSSALQAGVMAGAPGLPV